MAGSQGGGLGLAAIFGVLFTLYSSSLSIQSLMEGLNVAFETIETRGFFERYIVQFILTIGLIVGFLVVVAIGAALPAILAWLPLGDTLETVLGLARWPLMLLVVSFGLSILYRYGPDRHVAWRWITPGAALACLVWVLGTVAFTFYVSNFGSYNETFGTAGRCDRAAHLAVAVGLHHPDGCRVRQRDGATGQARPQGQTRPRPRHSLS